MSNRVESNFKTTPEPTNSANATTRRETLKSSAATLVGLVAASTAGCSAQAQTSQATTVADYPNVAIVKRYYEAYAKSDLVTIKEVLAPDIVWRIPGHHPLSGPKRGPDEVVAFFNQLAKANFKADVLFLGGNDEYVIDCHRGYGASGDAKLDILWCLVFRIKDGKIAEVTNFAGDQHAADAFFWAVYQLKPIPERLVTKRT